MSKRNRGQKPSGIPQQTVQQAAEALEQKSAVVALKQAERAADPQKAHTVADITPKEFLATAKDRKHAARRTTIKTLRHESLILFWNEYTKEFIQGELPENDIKILADSKQFLYSMSGNPYKLKDPHADANAFIQADMKELCIDGDIIDGKKVKLEARQVSKNRVTYWNPVLAQEIVNAAPDDETKQKYKARFDILNSLTPRDGYGSL
jgi:hypothetical protein